MYKMPKIRIGLIPTKRHPFRLEAALPQKQRYYDVFSQIDADVVEYVDIDDICEYGIIADPKYCQAVIDKFIKAHVSTASSWSSWISAMKSLFQPLPLS